MSALMLRWTVRFVCPVFAASKPIPTRGVFRVWAFRRVTSAAYTTAAPALTEQATRSNSREYSSPYPSVATSNAPPQASSQRPAPSLMLLLPTLTL